MEKEKLKNLMMMVYQNMKENILMEKEEEQEKNIMKMENLNLKVSI